MTLKHIVLFRFTPTTTPAEILSIAQNFIALKDKCIHPVQMNKYIVSLTGGIDNSIEGVAGGMTHAFMVEFFSVEDRDYYCKTDPAHAAFKKMVHGHLENAQVVDYMDGVF